MFKVRRVKLPYVIKNSIPNDVVEHTELKSQQIYVVESTKYLFCCAW